MKRDDFGDWLSPILVKEFRQGLRSRLFVVVFLTVQAAMVLGLSLALASASNGDYSSGSGVFWTVIGIPLGLIWPLASLGGIHTERKDDTLELLLLSRLTPRRIIVGKWFALFAQAVLLTTAVLPYLFFRYFTGGVDLASELRALSILLACSGLATLFGVAVSAYFSMAGRIIMVIVGLVSLQIMPAFFFRGFGAPSAALGDWFAWAATIYSILVSVLFIEAGSAKVAPESMRYAPYSRLCAVGLIVAWYVFGKLSHGFSGLEPLANVVTFGLVTAVCIVSMWARMPRSAGPFFRFARLGKAGRVLLVLFGPGWPSGVFFSALIMIGVLSMTTQNAAWHQKALLIITAGGTIFGLAAAAKFGQRQKRFAAVAPILWISLQAILCPFLAYANHTYWHNRLPWATALFPVPELTFAMSSEIATPRLETHIAISLGVLVLFGIGLVIAAFSTFKQSIAMHRDAENALRQAGETAA